MYSFFTKAVIYFLCSVTVLLFLAGALTTAIMVDMEMYSAPEDEVLQDNLEYISSKYAYLIGVEIRSALYIEDGAPRVDTSMAESLSSYITNSYGEVYFEAYLDDGTLIASNYAGEDYRFYCECNDLTYIYSKDGMTVSHSENAPEIFYDTQAAAEAESTSADSSDIGKEAEEETFTPDLSDYVYTFGSAAESDEEECIVNILTKVYVKETFPYSFPTFSRMAFTERFIKEAYSMRILCPALTAACFIASVLLFIFAMCLAGRRKGSEPVQPRFWDRIPFIVILAVPFLFAVAEHWLIDDVIRHLPVAVIVISVTALIYLDVIIVFAFLRTVVVRLKSGTFIKSTLCYSIVSLLSHIIKKVCTAVAKDTKELPLVRKTVLVTALVCAAELVTLFLYILWNSPPMWLLFWWLVEKLILVPAVIYVAIQSKRLSIGAKEISSGKLQYRIDTSGMPPELRRHGEALNSISDGLTVAVEEKLKSERLKTELITNVSHDIKTPLTSIINYVDLLKKEEPENEISREYLQVLERQSLRLKKLIEDLTEASKASTGNISVNVEILEADVLLEQVMGEYESRAAEAGLTIILSKPEHPISVLGDGNLMWRVLDNLMSNVCKYAQSGTRVYADLNTTEDNAVITLKNVSAFPLNISGDELRERFVRGDSSRSTEGSGLGLSIAESLMTLQGGRLTLSVDGDLFKATVTIPLFTGEL